QRFAVIGRKPHGPAGGDRRSRRQGGGQPGDRRVVARQRRAAIAGGGSVGTDRREHPFRRAGAAGEAGRRRRGRGWRERAEIGAVELQQRRLVIARGELQRGDDGAAAGIEDVATTHRVDLHRGELVVVVGDRQGPAGVDRIGRRQGDGEVRERTVVGRDGR